MTHEEIPAPFTAYHGDEAFLFVCFAHQDASEVYPDISWLRDCGANIWYDEGISPGHLWREDIANAIDQCSLFVVFLSEASVESANCRKEINYALEAEKPFLVIYLEDVKLPPGIALAIGEIQGILRHKSPLEQYRLKVLEFVEESLNEDLDETTPPPPTQKPRSSWWQLTIMVASLLIVAGAAWFFAIDRKTAESPRETDFAFNPRDWILLVFDNQTNNALLDGTLETAMRVALQESAHVNVLSRKRTRDSLQRMGRPSSTPLDASLGMEIALREGVSALVNASIEEQGDQYRIQGKIIDPESRSTVYTHSVEAGSETELLPQLSALTDTLRSALGEPEEMIRKRNVQLLEATTANLDALHIYSIAVETAYTVPLEETIDLLQQAILLDPGFAMAHSKLATYILAVDGDKTAAQYHYEAALAEVSRLSQKERLIVEAAYAWLDTPQEMERKWRVLNRLYPDDLSANHNLGAVRWEYFNDFNGAIPYFREVLSMDPENGGTLHYLGYCLLALGETEEALWAFDQSRKSTGMTTGMADAYLVMEDYALAEDSLRYTGRLTPGQQIPRITRLVSLELDQNRLRTAYDLAAEGLTYSEQAGAHRSAIGFAGARLAISTRLERADFERDLKVTIELITRLIEDDRLTRFPTRELALTGKLAIRQGDLQTGKDLHDFITANDDFEGDPMSRDYSELLAAEIVMAEGDPEAAAEMLELIKESSNLFQAHEGLARASALLGDRSREEAELRWMANHKGQALSQKSETVMGREMNLLDRQDAEARLADSL